MRPQLALFLVALLSVPGCSLLDRSPPPVVAPKLSSAGQPLVKPHEITPANARDKARVLNQELDRDLDGELE